jgi:GNAT superfamily N-acetyltransferase
MALFRTPEEGMVFPATRTDIKDFRQLFSGFQRHHFEEKSDFFINPKLINFDSESYFQLITDPRRKLFILRKRSVCIGMLLISIDSVPVGELQYSRTRPTIEMLYMHEKYRSQGGATKLVGAACIWAKEQGYSEIVTDVWEFSDTALKFFAEKEGFSTRSRRMYKAI